LKCQVDERQKTGPTTVKLIWTEIKMIEDARRAANTDRAMRVLKCSKHSTLISNDVKDLKISVKIEAKVCDDFDFNGIRQQINDIFTNCSPESEDIWKCADDLFLLLSETYNDNKISINITDKIGCGFTTNYYNNIPQQVIKI